MVDELEELDALTVRAVQALADDELIAPAVLRLLLRRYAMTGRDDLEAVLGPALARALDASALETAEAGQSAWLELLVEAASLTREERVTAAATSLIARLVPGLATAGETRTVARAMRSIHACLRAADLFSERDRLSSLVGESVDALERLVGPLYRPGAGMPHIVGAAARADGDLRDHINTASTLLAAHAWTGRLPYSMLAEELVQFVRRTCWPLADGSGAWNSDEFVSSCETVTVLCSLAALHADPDYKAAAVVAPDGDYVVDAAGLLGILSTASRGHDIAAAAEFGLAICDWLSLGH